MITAPRGRCGAAEARPKRASSRSGGSRCCARCRARRPQHDTARADVPLGSNSGSRSTVSNTARRLSTFFRAARPIDVMGPAGEGGTSRRDLVGRSGGKTVHKKWRGRSSHKAADEQSYTGAKPVARHLLGTGDDAAEMRVIGVVERMQT